jgi:hypothetical protein
MWKKWGEEKKRKRKRQDVRAAGMSQLDLRCLL